MKKRQTINVNKLQNDLSKVLKEVESGEVFEVVRYSNPVGYLIPKEQFEELISGKSCEACMRDLRKIAKKIEEER